MFFHGGSRVHFKCCVSEIDNVLTCEGKRARVDFNTHRLAFPTASGKRDYRRHKIHSTPCVPPHAQERGNSNPLTTEGEPENLG